MYIYCAMNLFVCLSVSNATSAFAIYVLMHNTTQLVKNLLHYDNIFVVKNYFFCICICNKMCKYVFNVHFIM